MTTRAEIIVKGVVHGVGFRWYVRRTAMRHDLTGYVKNLPDGNVYCEVEGDESMINAFISELKAGPPLSHVTEAIVNKLPGFIGYKNFEITF